MKWGDLIPWRRKADNVYDAWLRSLDGLVGSKAGQPVSLETALRVSAAFACLRVLSQGCAQTPFKLFQESEQGGLTRILPARKHPVYDVMCAKPNAWQTSFEFRETLVLHAALGNAYAFKNMYRGRPAELILLDPGRVKPIQNLDSSIVYRVTGRDGRYEEFSPDQIWHVRGTSWDGFLGMDTLNMAREALGLSLALEESHAKLHANGIRPSGTYSIDGKVDQAQYEQLVKWLKKNASAENSGAPLILDRGAKWLNTAMTGVDAQHKETRDFQIAEVCRFFGVLPIMIGHTGDKANTYASAEAMFTAHKVHTLDPWFTRIQESADLNLLTAEDRAAGYYFKFNANGLLRGSAKDRADYYSKALGAGGSPAWMTQDEVRALEELDPMGGDSAKLPVVTNAPAQQATP